MLNFGSSPKRVANAVLSGFIVAQSLHERLLLWSCNGVLVIVQHRLEAVGSRTQITGRCLSFSSLVGLQKADHLFPEQIMSCLPCLSPTISRIPELIEFPILNK